MFMTPTYLLFDIHMCLLGLEKF